MPETTGPFQAYREASESPAARAVYEAFRGDPGTGKMAGPNLRMLTEACEAAGVELGDYDRRILTWLADNEPETCAVIAGIISRAGKREAPDA
jgi:hypothetical protein